MNLSNKMQMDRKEHWETIYQTKEPHQVSWTQIVPKTSLQLIQASALPKDARIIDVGGGDSLLVDHLLDLGYENISVLDISNAAIERAKKRLGERQTKINWIVSDIINFNPKKNYDCWHDRAAFHFLTNENEVKKYVEMVNQSLKPGSSLIIGTFSDKGPEKCSGITIQQYSESSLEERFSDSFSKEECLRTEHKTPFETLQNFIFCRFKKKLSLSS